MILLDYISLGIGALAVLVITWGIVFTAIRWVSGEIRHPRSPYACERRETLRQEFGSYLLLGLEFLIAADVIQTIRQPGLEEIAILGGIVVIRTVISVFLDRELAGQGEVSGSSKRRF